LKDKKKMAARDAIVFLVIGAYRLVTHLFQREQRKKDLFPLPAGVQYN
jgi:hypothetical protein